MQLTKDKKYNDNLDLCSADLDSLFTNVPLNKEISCNLLLYILLMISIIILSQKS